MPKNIDIEYNLGPGDNYQLIGNMEDRGTYYLIPQESNQMNTEHKTNCLVPPQINVKVDCFRIKETKKNMVMCNIWILKKPTLKGCLR